MRAAMAGSASSPKARPATRQDETRRGTRIMGGSSGKPPRLQHRDPHRASSTLRKMDPTHTPAPVSPARPRNRGIYLLPNLFTTGGLFAGYYAIIAATQGRFD